MEMAAGNATPVNATMSHQSLADGFSRNRLQWLSQNWQLDFRRVPAAPRDMALLSLVKREYFTRRPLFLRPGKDPRMT
jgi:hypothetical protein